MSLKVFSKNAFVYAIGTAGLRVSAFLLIPIYTHYLVLKDYGLLSTILVSIQLMVTIIDMSVREGIMRLSSEYRNKNRIKYLFGSVVLINLLSGIILSVLSLEIFSWVFQEAYHIKEINEFIILTCIAALVQSLCINIISYYRASNEGLKYMVINIATAVLTIILSVGFFVFLKSGVKGAIIAQILSFGIIGIAAFVYITLQIGFGIHRPDVIYLLKYCLPLMMATLGFSVLNTSSTYFLSYFENLEHVGIYSLASRISQVGSILLILPFQLAYEPYVFANLKSSSIKDEISRLTTYLLLIYTVLSFFIVFLFRFMIKIIAPPEYYPAYYLLYFLLPAVAFNGLFYIGQSLLLINKKTRTTGSIVFMVSAAGVVLNYMLIRNYGITGLVINYNLSWIVIAYAILKYGMQEFPIKLEWKRIIFIGIAYIILHSAIYFLDKTASYFYYPASMILFIIFISVLWKYYLNQKEKIFIIEGSRKIIRGRSQKKIAGPQLQDQNESRDYYA